MFLRVMCETADVVGATSPDASALIIGTQEFRMSRRALRRAGITTISDERLSAYQALPRADRPLASKPLCAAFFRHFGYAGYSELDLAPSADIRCDLNDPCDDSLAESFDLVVNASAHWAMNSIQAFTNAARLVRQGGILIVPAIMGDVTNLFYLNPSPDFVIDFHEANGFVLERAVMTTHATRRCLPYRPLPFKHTPLPAMLSWRDFVAYHVKELVRNARVWRHARRRGSVSPPPLPAASEAPRERMTTKVLGRGLSGRLRPHYRRAMRTVERGRMWRDLWLTPEWHVWCVLRKVESVPSTQFKIIRSYRHHVS